MTNIAQLLSPEQQEALASIKAPAPVAIATCECSGDDLRAEFKTLPGTTLAVHSPCGRPTKKAAQILGHVYAKHLTAEAVANATDATLLVVPEPKPKAVVETNESGQRELSWVIDLPPVTTINGVDVDLRSEGRFETQCADCQTPLEVEIKPEGVDLNVLTSKPRVAVCLPCGETRVKGKRGVVIYTQPETKEHELDLNNFTNAELGAMAVEAREQMLAEAAEALPAKREAAMQAKAEAEAADAALKAQDRAQQAQRKVWMGEFLIHGITVPALDFTEVNLDEQVSSKDRSPYNKALHACGEETLDREDTTFRVLRKVHKRLWREATIAVEMPKGGHVEPERVEPKADVLLAQIDPDADAKVRALSEVLNLSLDEARERLASLNIA